MADGDGPKHWGDDSPLVNPRRAIPISNDAMAVVDRLTSLITIHQEISRTLGSIEKTLDHLAASQERVADGTK